MGCLPSTGRHGEFGGGDNSEEGGFVTAMEITDATYRTECNVSSEEDSDEAATEGFISATKDEALLRRERVAALRGRLASLTAGGHETAAATAALGEMEMLASRKEIEARALEVVWRFRRVCGQYAESEAVRQRFFVWRGRAAQGAALLGGPRALRMPRLRLQ